MKGRCAYILTLFCIFNLICAKVLAQSSFKAGFAKTSIEPTNYPFSLALAGYGFPRDGRFSLEWIKTANLSNCTAFTGNADRLFAVSEGRLFYRKLKAELSWKSIGAAANIISLAAGPDQLFAVDKKGTLLSTGFSALKWKTMGSVQDAVSIAVLNKYIYYANSKGVIFTAKISSGKLNWIKLTELSELRSIAAYDDNLYGLTVNDDLMKYDLSRKNVAWLKIARYNDVSYDVRIKFIAVGNHRLYGIDQNHSIFQAKHLSTGGLSVSAMVISSGKNKVAIVGADLCGLGHDFVSSVKDAVSRKYHIPAEAVMINLSHTHFGPVAQHWPAWPEFDQQPDSLYMNQVLRPAIIRAIGLAVRELAPSDLYFGRGKTAIGENRSLSGDNVPYDNDVDVLQAVRKDNKNKTVLFMAGCHPVFTNEGAESYTISANYPGVARAALESSTDGSNTLFIQGCGGDINPVDDNHMNTGETLANDVKTVLSKPMEKLEGGISFYLNSINFPVKIQTEAEILRFKQDNTNDGKDVYAEKNVRWADYMLRLKKENKIPKNMPVYVQTLNIGDWKLVGLSREAVTDYSLGIKKLWPNKLVSVAGYCNDVSSYLPTERHIKAVSYEGLDSFYWYGQPSVFPENVYDVILNKIELENH